LHKFSSAVYTRNVTSYVFASAAKVIVVTVVCHTALQSNYVIAIFSYAGTCADNQVSAHVSRIKLNTRQHS